MYLLNSGKFDRVILSQWQISNQNSFELALENVRAYYSVQGNPFAFLTDQEFEEEAGRYPELRPAFVNAFKGELIYTSGYLYLGGHVKDVKVRYANIKLLFNKNQFNLPANLKEVASRLKNHAGNQGRDQPYRPAQMWVLNVPPTAENWSPDIDTMGRGIVTSRLDGLKTLVGGLELTGPYLLVIDPRKAPENPARNYKIGDLLRSFPRLKVELQELRYYG